MTGTGQDRKRLLVTTSTFPRWPGDKEPPFVFDLCAWLSQYYDIHVVSPHCTGAADEEWMHGVQVSRFRYSPERLESLAYEGGILPSLRQKPWRYGLVPGFLASELVAILKILRSRRIDLIHAHWLIPQGLVAALARKLSGRDIPLICTSHGSDLLNLEGRLVNRAKKWVAGVAGSITVVSDAMKDEVVGLGGDREKIRVIPMGIDLKNRFLPPEKRPGGKSILYVGRLTEEKGVRDLLSAFRSIRERVPEAELTIVGHGPDEQALRALCSDLETDKSVKFTGAVEHGELPALYGTSDVVVFPSSAREGFGLVPAEALGCECAVVATDLPSTRNFLVDGRTCLVVPRGSVAGLAESVVRLLEDPRLREELGRQGRKEVENRFDLSVVGEKYLELIETLLGQSDGAAGCGRIFA